MAKISVIVPVYKVEPYLRRCADSILAQTFRDFELILVDDGSPDNCGAICDEYAQRDMRVHVIHQSNGGLSAARNAGLDWMFANSSNEYVTFIDSDDWVSENYFEELLKGSSEHNGNCMSIASITSVYDDGREACLADAEPTVLSVDEYWVLGELLPMVAWGKLIRRRHVENVRFPVGLVHEDEYTTPKFLVKSDMVQIVRKAKYYYFRHADSITGVEWKDSRLVAIAALKWQICFFNELGRTQSAKVSRMRLAWNYANAIRFLNRDEYRLPLRSELRELRMPLLSNKQLHFLAYPVRARIAWPFVRLFDIVRRRGMVGAVRQYLRRFKHC